MKPGSLLAGLATLLLLGCGGINGARPAETATLISASAVVQSVDQATREVVLRADDGTMLSMVAGPEVRNLPQVAAGDVVTINYYASVLLSMAEPGATDAALAAAGRAPEGARPGAAAVVTTDTVVTVISYDANSGLATFRTEDGVIHRSTVPPELRSFAAARAPGSRVNVSMTEAVAVSITES